MNTTKKDPREVLDLRADNTEFEVTFGVGNNILYHGTEVNLGRILRAKAEEIALDPEARYLCFTEARVQADLAASQVTAAAPKAAALPTK